MESNSTSNNVVVIRKLAHQYVDGLQWESGLFWAELAVTLSNNGNVDDTIAYLRCLIELGHHLRALSLLENRGLLRAHRVFQYFGARCLFVSNRYEEVVQLIEAGGPTTTAAAAATPAIGGGESSIITPQHDPTARRFNRTISTSSASTTTTTFTNNDVALLSRYADEWKIDSGILLLLGKSYEKLENRQQAANCYKQCLLRDFSCIEAFDRLIRRHMLTEADERDLLNRLFVVEQQKSTDATANGGSLIKLAKLLYKSRSSVKFVADSADHDDEENEQDDSSSKELKKLLQSANLSVMVGTAERLYYHSKYPESYRLSTKILAEEEYHSETLPVHVGNLVALSKTTELYSLAHKLIDAFPDLLISWYAVACYYYAIENFEAAKRFFHKCTLLDPHHGASWIGYGHSFAVEQEHDQAMNCYVKAAKVMSCCHLPLTYVGLEYSLTNNLRLAEKFCLHALSMAPNDLYVLHELGVLYYRSEQYAKAEEYFRKTEQAVVGAGGAGKHQQQQQPAAWEQLWNNMGHVMRKLKRYDEALEYHKRALRLCPRNASTLAAIGYLHMFRERFVDAVEYFHQSLSLKRDDAFVTALLTKAMDILNDTWKTQFDEPPTLIVPVVRIQGSSSSSPASNSKKTPARKAAAAISDADETISDVEMEDA